MGTLNRSLRLLRSAALDAVMASFSREAAPKTDLVSMTMGLLGSRYKSGKRQGTRASAEQNRENRADKALARREEREQIPFELRQTLKVRAQVRESMTNWQATQWMKAGAPRKIKDMKKFATMPHWKEKAVA